MRTKQKKTSYNLMNYVIKRDYSKEKYTRRKIEQSLKGAFKDTKTKWDPAVYKLACMYVEGKMEFNNGEIDIEEVQNLIERALAESNHLDVQKNYILYRNQHAKIREWVTGKEEFIKKYKTTYNTADSTIDDNSNVASKNIAILNNEIHKPDNIEISRKMVMNKLKEIFPEFDPKEYIRDLSARRILYKHDESSFAGAIAPYCVSTSMYQFLINGIKDLGGLSAAPKNLDSFCGMYINYIFAVASQFAGAVATSEFLLYFDYFARKEWGDEYYLKAKDIYVNTEYCTHRKTIQKQIRQYFQQVVYSINQPAAARGMQSAFVNFSYFDKPFFEGMFGDFYFPDNTQPKWESLCWLQKEFMQWFNEERTRCILTFPVESFALVYKDGHFLDQDAADFVAEEYARGHSFFTYISDTVDSLSSCCRLKNMVQTKEFNFTNGNMGVMTGSKSVITLNLSRIFQNINKIVDITSGKWKEHIELCRQEIGAILSRVYKYHTAYNELLWDMKDAGLLPVYSAHFIDLNKQYLTIGLNGLNQAAEFLGMDCRNNSEYRDFCQFVFGFIKEQNTLHNGKFNNHQLTFNTEQVPAESLAIKNYNWDKEDGYWVPKDTNLYASYIFKPNDERLSLFEKIDLHGRDYIGDYLDGGAAAHLNLDTHLTKDQYAMVLNYAALKGCQYFTFNIPNSECQDCGFITKTPICECPKCGSKKIALYDRVIGYLTKINNWSEGRRIEQKSRVYQNIDKWIEDNDPDVGPDVVGFE